MRNKAPSNNARNTGKRLSVANEACPVFTLVMFRIFKLEWGNFIVSKLLKNEWTFNNLSDEVKRLNTFSSNGQYQIEMIEEIIHHLNIEKEKIKIALLNRD